MWRNRLCNVDWSKNKQYKAIMLLHQVYYLSHCDDTESSDLIRQVSHSALWPQISFRATEMKTITQLHVFSWFVVLQ